MSQHGKIGIVDLKSATYHSTILAFHYLLIPFRVSDLVTGKWEKFGLEMLITLATRAGIRVHIKTAA